MDAIVYNYVHGFFCTYKNSNMIHEGRVTKSTD